MKKIIGVAIASALIFNTSFAVFSDVPEEHWANSAISKMQENGILNGYTDGTFKPNKNITLAEFATIFTRVFDIPVNKSSDYFTEVPDSHWAKNAIEAIRKYINPYYDSLGEAVGIDQYSYMDGITGDLEMTREAFIYATTKIYGYDESSYTEGEEKKLFVDYEDILFPKEMVLAYKAGMIKGEIIDGKTYIRPKRYITRAEVSTIFNSLLKSGATKVKNEFQESELKTAFDEIISDVKEADLEGIKEKIYDTSDILKNKYFTISEKGITYISEIFKNYFDKLDYEIEDTGFNGFNSAYVKVKFEGYDVKESLEKIYNEAYLNFENESLETMANSFAAEIKDMMKNRKISKSEFEETFNFIKEDGKWKLSL